MRNVDTLCYAGSGLLLLIGSCNAQPEQVRSEVPCQVERSVEAALMEALPKLLEDDISIVPRGDNSPFEGTALSRIPESEHTRYVSYGYTTVPMSGRWWVDFDRDENQYEVDIDPIDCRVEGVTHLQVPADVKWNLGHIYEMGRIGEYILSESRWDPFRPPMSEGGAAFVVPLKDGGEVEFSINEKGEVQSFTYPSVD